jgi:hypothetical protein
MAKARKKAAKKTKKPSRKVSREPKTFSQQLGIKEGEMVVCLHCKEQFITRLRSQLPPYARLFQTVQDDKAPDVVIRFFNEHADFDASFRWLEKRLNPGGCIWGVIIKKSALRVGQRDLRNDMAAAAKRAGMVETRNVPFSAVEYGIKFVRRQVRNS